MNVHQRHHAQAPVENEEQLQQERNTSNKLLDTLHWLQNELYNYISPSIRYAVQFIRYGLQIIFLCLFIIVFILGVIYIIWNYVLKKLIYLLICQSIFGYIPIVWDHCELLSASDKDKSTTTVLPIDSVIEKTVSIAERLSETDVSTPVKITEIGIALIDLKTSVLYSEIEQAIKSQLLEHIEDIRISASTTADEIRRMIAAFNNVLAKIEVYVKDLHRVLIKENGNEIGSKFKEFLGRIENEIERLIHLANDVHLQLVNLEKKPEVLVEITAPSHQIEQKKLDEIEHASIISKIYHVTIGNGNINKVKYQRNLKVFDQFPEFTKMAAVNIENVIGKLRDFKHEIEEVKYTVSKMDRAQTLQVDVHIEILNNALESLQKYRKQFDRRITDNSTNRKQISN